MPQLAERSHVNQRRPGPIARRPQTAAAQSPRTVAQLQAREGAPVATRITSPVSEKVNVGQAAKSSSGGGLPPRLRAGVEALSGFAMDDVRVHRNSSEPEKLGALAFTRGAEIHLGPGQEEHLPHEAWHVVQQKQGRVQATTQMKGAAINDDAGLEREADRMGELARTAPAPNRFRLFRSRRSTGPQVHQCRPQKGRKPAKSPSIHGPPPIKISLLAPNLPGWRTVTDDEIYAPLKELEQKDRQAFEAEKRQRYDLLRARMRNWLPEDQEFALRLLERVYQHSVNVDPRGVSDADRQPILDRYEQWMRREATRHGLSWFSKETLGSTHAASEIDDLRRQLSVFRGPSPNALDQVYEDVQLYRRRTDNDPTLKRMSAFQKLTEYFILNQKHVFDRPNFNEDQLQKIVDSVIDASRDYTVEVAKKFFRYYASHDIKNMSGDEEADSQRKNVYALTDPNGDTRLRTDVINFPSGILGPILLHELGHTKDTQSGMGLGGFQEGHGYAVEYFFSKDSDRKSVIHVLLNGDAIFLAAQKEAGKKLYRVTLATLMALGEVIQNGSSDHLPASLLPDGTSPREAAEKLMAERVQQVDPSSKVLKAITKHIEAHINEFDIKGLGLNYY